MNQSRAYGAIAVLTLLAGGALLLRREKANTSGHVASAAPATAIAAAPSSPDLAPTAEPSAVASAPVIQASAAPSLDEASFMKELRTLRKASPGRALELARSGSDRFGDSADAAERSWIIVKSLSELGRHEEARAEGRKLVERYRDTRWGQDAYRHLFVNPPTHPSERGYGKTLEDE